MKDRIFGVLTRIGRSFMLPIAVLPIAGLFLGVGGSFSNETMISLYHLEAILGPGTILGNIMLLLNDAGSAVFNNLALLFAIAVAIGMSNREKATGALAAVLGFLIMNAVIARFLVITNSFDTASLTTYNNNLLLAGIADGSITNVDDFVPIAINDPSIHQLPQGSTTSLLGYTTLSTGVFGGIIVGLLAAYVTNKFYNLQLPPVISFFSGTRSVPIITAFLTLILGVIMFYVWPFVQMGMSFLGSLVDATGLIGTFIYGYIERALIPFGLHHVFYLPFWQTAIGGTYTTTDGREIAGAQTIYFELIREGQVDMNATQYTRFMAGKFPFMIFGLPGAALAMYQTAYEEKKDIAGGLLLSAALAAMLTGITEPIEFTFIFVAPALYYGVHCVLAGLSFMLMHLFNVAVGMTFSGGIIDLTLFGVLQGFQTNWYMVIVVGVVYFFIYWFLFRWIIIHFDLATPGREKEEGAEVKLYTRADVNAAKAGDNSGKPIDMKSAAILKGLGGKDNLDGDVDCCITRLRLMVKDPAKVDEDLLKQTGAVGTVLNGKGLQVIYGPTVPSVKNALEEFLETPEADHVDEIIGAGDEIVGDKTTDNIVNDGPFTEYFQAPIAGKLEDVSKTPDDAFAKKMLGDGIVIFPTDNKVCAPCDGTIEVLFPTHHAIGMKSSNGVELLIHVGIDTVNLNGKGFTAKVEEKQEVKRGQELLEIDLDYIRKNAKSDAVPMIFTALPEDMKVEILKNGNVTLDEDVVMVTNLKDA